MLYSGNENTAPAATLRPARGCPGFPLHAARQAAFAVALGACVLAGPASATDMIYSIQSPSFGGNNSAALQMEQLQNSTIAATRNAQKAAAAAAAAAAVAASPSTAVNTQAQNFANTLMAQLNSIISAKIASQIANSQNGAAGTIVDNGVTLVYTNSDGQLNVTIQTPNGVSTITLPTGQ